MKIYPYSFEKRKGEDLDIYSHVTWLLSFRDKKEQIKYEGHKSSKLCRNSFLLIFLLVTVYFIIFDFGTLKDYPTPLSNVRVVISMVFPTFHGLLIVLLNYKLLGSKYLDFLSSWRIYLESTFLFGVITAFNLGTVSAGQNGMCPNLQVHGCNTSEVAGKFPLDMVIAAVALPIIVGVVARGATWPVHLASFFMSIGIPIGTVLYYQLDLDWVPFVFFSIGCGIVLYEYQRQSIAVFILSESQDQLMVEIERLVEEAHAKELRAIVSNVAHDLKTPMTALVNGLEYVNAVVSDMKTNKNDFDLLSQGVASIADTANNLRNVNSFMLMSINRCLDYTKASNGVPLVPHLQKVKLRELLSVPIHCIQDLQEGRMEIKLLPIPSEVSSVIVTDKQWFQENLLCILSNAVKFSTEGHVSVSVSLVKEAELRPTAPIFSMAPMGHLASPSVSQRPVQTMLRVDVEDSGLGIKEEDIRDIFLAVKQARRFTGGTGLGLYSLAKRIDALGGCYGIDPRRDGKHGCDIWFSVPYKIMESAGVVEIVGTPRTRPPLGSPGSPAYPINLDGLPALHSFDDSSRLFTGFNKKVLQQNEFLSSRTRSISTGTKEVEAELQSVVSEPQSIRSQNSSLVSAPRISAVTPLRVLLVDDAISILKITGMMLRRLGHSVVTAENGAVALKLLLSPEGSLVGGTHFDVVLMDLQMPIMDGLEATRRLRSAEKAHNASLSSYDVGDVEDQLIRRRRQKIIGVSACSDEETIQSAFDAGIDAFIAKPFNMDSFNETYSRLCEGKISTV